MVMKEFICWLQILLLVLLPVVPARGQADQDLEEQAQFYLQRVGPSTAPGPVPMTPSPRITPPSGLRPGQPGVDALGRPRVVQQPQPQVLTTAPQQPEEISAIERRAWDQMMFVRQYGYSFFSQPPTTFLPLQDVPVGPDYIIGPGDTIRLVLWGSVQGEHHLTVDRQGQITVPQVGVIHVSGLTFGQLQTVMDRELKRQYQNFQFSVTLDNLRTIQVFVVGQARMPGSYSVSSLATVVNALYAAGGSAKSGSMRNIEVRRGNRVAAHFDMYDFLLKGDKTKDIRLMNGDVIFIPPVGPLVAIGTPKTPEELEEELTILARMELEEESALMRQMRITEPVEINWKSQEARRIVTGDDPVQRKRRMEELLRQTPGGIPVPPENIHKAEPERPSRGPTASWLKQGEEAENRYFKKRFGLTLKEAGQKVAMSRRMEGGGPIKVPGIFELKQERTLKDLLGLCGGLGDTAFKGRVQVLRVKNHKEMVLFEDDLEKVIRQTHPAVTLVDGDFVRVFKVPALVERKVAIAGAVRLPGEYGLTENMRVKDLVQLAGGLLHHASTEALEITRFHTSSSGTTSSQLTVNLKRALADDPRENVRLQPNDYLFVRPMPEWDVYKTVVVEGEVKYPGTYAIRKGETLSSLLTRVGGFTPSAYPFGAVLTRPSVKKQQKEELARALDQAEAITLAYYSGQTQQALEPEEVRRAEYFAKLQQQLLGRLRSIEPLGRVIVRVDDPERIRGTVNDIPLMDGDKLVVPQNPGTVSVLGAVFSPSAVVYASQATVNDYIRMAGGANRVGDMKNAYVIKANGSAVGRSSFGRFGFGQTWDGYQYVHHMGGVGSLRLDPGDTVVVPERLEKVTWLKPFKDIVTIIAQLALTAGVIIVGLRN